MGEEPAALGEIVERLRGQDVPSEILRAEAAKAAALGREALPGLLRLYEQEDETLLALATVALKAMNERAVLRPLLALLGSDRVDDLARGLILKVLEHHGLDITDPRLLGISIDLDAMVGPPGEGPPEPSPN